MGQQPLLMPKSRKEAQRIGSPVYCTGKACPRGHFAPRWTKNCCCHECQKEYKREHYRQNKSQYQEKFRTYTKENRWKKSLVSKRWRSRWPERQQASRDTWNKKNPSYSRIRILKAMPSWADSDVISSIYEEAKKRTEETGEMHHVDHIIPLKGEGVCGLHVASNLQVLRAKENLSKANLFDESMIS